MPRYEHVGASTPAEQQTLAIRAISRAFSGDDLHLLRQVIAEYTIDERLRHDPYLAQRYTYVSSANGREILGFNLTDFLRDNFLTDSISRLDLHQLNFTGWNLAGLQALATNFSDSIFDEAHMERMFADSANFTHASMRNAHAEHGVFSRAIVADADMTGMHLDGASLQMVQISPGTRIDGIAHNEATKHWNMFLYRHARYTADTSYPLYPIDPNALRQYRRWLSY